MDTWYRCAHCQRFLAPYIEGDPAPTCDDHPEGVVETTTDTPDGPALAS